MVTEEVQALAETAALDGYMRALLDVETLVDQMEATIKPEFTERAAPYFLIFRAQLEKLEAESYETIRAHLGDEE